DCGADDSGGGDEGDGWAVARNIPRTIAACISARLASLYELQTVYGVKDLYDLLEIASVQAENERRSHQMAQQKTRT
ncbi:MAG: hypothetical protein M3036_11345, partial [Bifidobacteriales bacterium]|nr:hypothetical protein [Bifidobacteriales bacterium]